MTDIFLFLIFISIWLIGPDIAAELGRIAGELKKLRRGKSNDLGE